MAADEETGICRRSAFSRAQLPPPVKSTSTRPKACSPASDVIAERSYVRSDALRNKGGDSRRAFPARHEQHKIFAKRQRGLRSPSATQPQWQAVAASPERDRDSSDRRTEAPLVLHRRHVQKRSPGQPPGSSPSLPMEAPRPPSTPGPARPGPTTHRPTVAEGRSRSRSPQRPRRLPPPRKALAQTALCHTHGRGENTGRAGPPHATHRGPREGQAPAAVPACLAGNRERRSPAKASCCPLLVPQGTCSRSFAFRSPARTQSGRLTLPFGTETSLSGSRRELLRNETSTMRFRFKNKI